MLDIQDKLSEQNPFFNENKLLPWIQVLAHRTKQIECVVPKDENEKCWAAFGSDEILKDDFNGSPYTDGESSSPVSTRFDYVVT